ncbi:hypothetical protein Tco_0356114 [Tanacetum coccineum]
MTVALQRILDAQQACREDNARYLYYLKYCRVLTVPDTLRNGSGDLLYTFSVDDVLVFSRGRLMPIPLSVESAPAGEALSQAGVLKKRYSPIPRLAVFDPWRLGFSDSDKELVSWGGIKGNRSLVKMCKEWEVGMEIGANVNQDDVEKLARELMDRIKGKRLRKTYIEWKTKSKIVNIHYTNGSRLTDQTQTRTQKSSRTESQRPDRDKTTEIRQNLESGSNR